MEPAIIGIDPGVSGGLALVSDKDLEAIAMPTAPREIYELIMQWRRDFAASHVFIERVGASPQMGVRSLFTFGRSYGAIEMAALISGVPLTAVPPQTWQRYFGLLMKGRKLGQSDTEKKNRNKQFAITLFPELDGITHAIADALLIAEYGRRQVIAGC